MSEQPLKIANDDEITFVYRSHVASVWIPKPGHLTRTCYAIPDFAAVIRLAGGKEVVVSKEQWEQTKTFLGITE